MTVLPMMFADLPGRNKHARTSSELEPDQQRQRSLLPLILSSVIALLKQFQNVHIFITSKHNGTNAIIMQTNAIIMQYLFRLFLRRYKRNNYAIIISFVPMEVHTQ